MNIFLSGYKTFVRISNHLVHRLELIFIDLHLKQSNLFYYLFTYALVKSLIRNSVSYNKDYSKNSSNISFCIHKSNKLLLILNLYLVNYTCNKHFRRVFPSFLKCLRYWLFYWWELSLLPMLGLTFHNTLSIGFTRETSQR